MKRIPFKSNNKNNIKIFVLFLQLKHIYLSSMLFVCIKEIIFIYTRNVLPRYLTHKLIKNRINLLKYNNKTLYPWKRGYCVESKLYI